MFTDALSLWERRLVGRGTHSSKAAKNHPNLGKRSNKSFKDLLLQRKALSSLTACPDSRAVLEDMEICLLYEGTFH